MRAGLGSVLLIALFTTGAGPSPAPHWSVTDVRQIVAGLRQAGSVPDPRLQQAEMARVACLAYGLESQAQESVDQRSRRVVQHRTEQGPVRPGQWLDAALLVLYRDLEARTRHLGRFARERADRQFLGDVERQARQAQAALAPRVQRQVEGLDGYYDALVVVAEGDEPVLGAAMVKVHDGGVVTIEEMDRTRFQNHLPPGNAPRTSRGAIRELMAAQKQFNITAEMLGRYEPEWRRKRGHVRVAVPAAYPARYLNEIVRGSVEAEMHTLHLLVMTRTGQLRELKLGLGGKGQPVRCEDAAPMSDCVRRMVHAGMQSDARLRFVVD